MITFSIPLDLWIVLSGRFDLFHLSLGIIFCAIVTYFTGLPLFDSRKPKGLLSSWIRLARCTPWLLYQIFLANLHLMYYVFTFQIEEVVCLKKY